ncbi:hypothetical protein [Methyloferula stellata]|uniref:hypothetical protein n=1 Tax=Methyloferula stellata TaxID=876270 RepID=UPI000478DBB5|nr:hypothetical protein [Methyloferula stellata]
MKQGIAGPAIFVFVLAMIAEVMAYAAGIRLPTPSSVPHPKSEVHVASMVQVRPQAKVHEAWCARGRIVGGFCVIR